MEKKHRGSKNKKFVGIVVAVILVLVVAGFLWTQSAGGIEVETELISVGDVSKVIKQTGIVESDSTSLITAKTVMDIKGFDFQEGDVVSAGQVILSTDVTAAQLTVKSMESEAAGLRIQYNRAKDMTVRSKLLYDQGAISRDEYLMVETSERQLASQLSAINYSIASMKETMDTGGITAPISGVITQVFAKVGETVMPGTPILELSDLDRLYISTYLIASDADQIKTESRVLVSDEDTGFHDPDAAVRKIHLKAIDFVSDLGISQKRVKVEVRMSKLDGVRLGSEMDVEITVDSRTNVVVASKKSIFEFDGKHYAYVVEDGKAALREVEPGLKGEDIWEIRSGLSDGETVIVSPGNDIDEGTKIKQ
ncbi:MAG: hypothetical protein CVU86_08060 [Firmicutes bacterium HGW-Firmicutes-11]|nr:MAG: hypothetical protein CVU86_08060 [Firmicutes bacterium HGW-Firmicutes-11]